MVDEENQRPDESQFDASAIAFYRAMFDYLESVDWKSNQIVGFALSDGTYRFSTTDTISVIEKLAQESLFSERLLVIVSVAYLEDQLRVLLSQFMTKDKITNDLLNPSDSMLASLVPMATLAYSLGLLAKSWLEILKLMAKLRNKFAHIPSAISINELSRIDSKTEGILESLRYRLSQFPGDDQLQMMDSKQLFWEVFITMYALLQYVIDHIAVPNKRIALNDTHIMKINTISGFDRLTLQTMIEQEN